MIRKKFYTVLELIALWETLDELKDPQFGDEDED
jgi:hypothetical protein